jgi:hypothetical protein
VIRSRWSDSKDPPCKSQREKPLPVVSLSMKHSEIIPLATEHRQLVFDLIKETRRQGREAANCSLASFLASSLLLSGLTATSAVVVINGVITQAFHLLWALGTILSALCLLSSMILSLYGTVLIWRKGSSSNISSAFVPRQQILNLAQQELDRLRDAEKRTSLVFRWSAWLFFAALLPYMLALALLVLFL